MIVEMNITYILWPLPLISFNINLEQVEVVTKASILPFQLKSYLLAVVTYKRQPYEIL